MRPREWEEQAYESLAYRSEQLQIGGMYHNRLFREKTGHETQYRFKREVPQQRLQAALVHQWE